MTTIASAPNVLSTNSGPDAMRADLADAVKACSRIVELSKLCRSNASDGFVESSHSSAARRPRREGVPTRDAGRDLRQSSRHEVHCRDDSRCGILGENNSGSRRSRGLELGRNALVSTPRKERAVVAERRYKILSARPDLN